MSERPTALIAEDEELLRAHLARRLAQLWPELELVGAARNGEEALALAALHAPDVAFLDIRMPGPDGMEVARRIGRACHLVFVTAYDEYAVRAFEQEAVDYLLKPVEDERLMRAVERLKVRLAQAEAPALPAALVQALSPAARTAPLRWIRVLQREVVRMVPVDEVRCFLAADKYTEVITAESGLLIRKPIRELELELDPERFWRVHRNAIVNLGFVEGCRRDDAGRSWLRLRGVAAPLPVSRAYAHLFKAM